MDLDTAIAVATKNLEVSAHITSLSATDAADSERSLLFKLTPEESSQVWGLVLELLSAR